MTSAAQDALGSDTEVRVELAPDAEGIRLSDLGPAAGVVRLTWDEPEHRRARLLCFLAGPQRWIDREVVFAADDPDAERGRTLGFLVASIFIHAEEAQSPPSPPRSGASARPGTAAVPAPVRVARAEASASDRGAPPAAPPSSSIGAAAEVAVGDAATGYGFWLGGEHAVWRRRVWLGLSAQGRFGTIDDAQATSRFLALGLHATWLFWRPSERAWLGVRAGASVAELSATHLSADDAGQPHSERRLIPAGLLLLQTGYRFTPASALSAQLGGQFLPGVTDIYVHQRRVATWPWVALLSRVGVETSF